MYKNPRLLIYKSSAGSGKTYTLAKAYLKMLLASPCANNDIEKINYHRHILAVTFTNDAAREMKNRVLDYLKSFAYNEEKGHKLLEEIKNDIYAEYNLDLDLQALRTSSLTFLKSILHGFSEFNIMTIDAFTNQVSKSFARDLGLPFNYEVHLDQNEKIAESVDSLLSNIDSGNGKLLSWLKQFMIHAVENQTSWDISSSISEFSNSLGSESKTPFIETLDNLDLDDFLEVRNSINKELNKLILEIKDSAKTIEDEINEKALDDEDFKGKRNGIFNFLRRLQNEPFRPISQTNLKNLEEGNIAHPQSPNRSIIETHQSRWISAIIELNDISNANRSRYIILSNLTRAVYQIGVINLVKNELEQIQESEEIIFLSQLTEKIRNIILSEPVPYIYERIGVKYRHILIDEFQDTSRFQWINFIPLISNALANGGDCLVVGDAKQSIYQWRGAQPQSIVDLPNIDSVSANFNIQEHGLQFKTTADTKVLNKNWRSKDQLVAFNNHFFDWVKTSFSQEIAGIDSFYSDVVQEPNGQVGGLVKISMLENDIDNDNRTEIMLDFMMEEIRLLESEKVDFGKITVLVRKNKEASLVAERLNEAQINVVSSESMLLKNSLGIKVIMSLLVHLEDPFNAEKRLDLFNILLKKEKREPQSWSEVADKIGDNDSNFIAFLNTYFDWENPLNNQFDHLYEYVQGVIQNLDLQKSTYDQAYLDQLLEDIHSKSVRGTIELGAYLEHWSKIQDSLAIKSTSSENAIKVMSIHKAKGLEFSIVIMPFVDWSIKPRTGTKIWSLWPNSGIKNLNMVILPHKVELKDSEFSDAYDKLNTDVFVENINMLYVAFTRAVDGLIIISRHNSKAKTSKTVGDIIQKFLESESAAIQSIHSNGFEIHQYVAGILPEMSFISSDTSNRYEGSKLLRKSIAKKLKWQTESHLEDDLASPLNLGDLIHTLMARFKYVDQRHLILKESEILTVQNPGVLNKIIGFIDHLLSEELTLSFYKRDWLVLTEQEVLFEGKVLRPDRLQFREDDILIIDYKTGELLESHKAQISSYIQALKSVYSGKNVQGYLIYMDPFLVHNVKT